MLRLRDPIHGFLHADPLEAALIGSRPLQRLRWIHQLGFTFLVYPGAEHSRFSHVLGAMHMAGRVFDNLVAKRPQLLPEREDVEGIRAPLPAVQQHRGPRGWRAAERPCRACAATGAGRRGSRRSRRATIRPRCAGR